MFSNVLGSSDVRSLRPCDSRQRATLLFSRRGGEIRRSILEETNDMFTDEPSAAHVMQLPKSGTTDSLPIIQ